MSFPLGFLLALALPIFSLPLEAADPAFHGIKLAFHYKDEGGTKTGVDIAARFVRKAEAPNDIFVSYYDKFKRAQVEIRLPEGQSKQLLAAFPDTGNFSEPREFFFRVGENSFRHGKITPSTISVAIPGYAEGCSIYFANPDRVALNADGKEGFGQLSLDIMPLHGLSRPAANDPRFRLATIRRFAWDPAAGTVYVPLGLSKKDPTKMILIEKNALDLIKGQNFDTKTEAELARLTTEADLKTVFFVSPEYVTGRVTQYDPRTGARQEGVARTDTLDEALSADLLAASERLKTRLEAAGIATLPSHLQPARAENAGQACGRVPRSLFWFWR